jgi:hypothetical protein
MATVANSVQANLPGRDHGLSVDQALAIEKIATSGRVLDVLVGPAGSGKSTTMAGLRAAWEAEHGPGSVIGLAPSAVAAQVLADELGIETENTAKWLHEWRRIPELTTCRDRLALNIARHAYPHFPGAPGSAPGSRRRTRPLPKGASKRDSWSLSMRRAWLGPLPSTSLGDEVVTRQNNRLVTTGRTWVKNGDRWDCHRHQLRWEPGVAPWERLRSDEARPAVRVSPSVRESARTRGTSGVVVRQQRPRHLLSRTARRHLATVRASFAEAEPPKLVLPP